MVHGYFFRSPQLFSWLRNSSCSVESEDSLQSSEEYVIGLLSKIQYILIISSYLLPDLSRRLIPANLIPHTELFGAFCMRATHFSLLNPSRFSNAQCRVIQISSLDLFLSSEWMFVHLVSGQETDRWVLEGQTASSRVFYFILPTCSPDIYFVISVEPRVKSYGRLCRGKKPACHSQYDIIFTR
jgi:hypothetical protein